jgi:Fur family transcriptional regulator, ferric uptake regulator
VPRFHVPEAELCASSMQGLQIRGSRWQKSAAKRELVMTALKSPSAPQNSGIEARCAATGMRMTEQRRVIARVLAEAEDHPDVEELYRRCAEVDDKISISTVYRTVKLFEDAGIIERHDFRAGRARYEQMRDSHHDHLINLRDGKVIEFTSEEIEKLQAEIARKLGYKLVDHRLELYCVPLDDDKS